MSLSGWMWLTATWANQGFPYSTSPRDCRPAPIRGRSHGSLPVISSCRSNGICPRRPDRKTVVQERDPSPSLHGEAVPLVLLQVPFVDPGEGGGKMSEEVATECRLPRVGPFPVSMLSVAPASTESSLACDGGEGEERHETGSPGADRALGAIFRGGSAAWPSCRTQPACAGVSSASLRTGSRPTGYLAPTPPGTSPEENPG